MNCLIEASYALGLAMIASNLADIIQSANCGQLVQNPLRIYQTVLLE